MSPPTLSFTEDGQAGGKSDLQQFASIVLKNVSDAVPICEFLQFPYVRKKVIEFFLVGMGIHLAPPTRRSAGLTSSAFAIRSILSIDTFRSPRSTDPM